jgi:hypothetical protein
VKDIVDPRLLVPKRHLLEAEVGIVAGLRHGE